jgi:hypothetical protein
VHQKCCLLIFTEYVVELKSEQMLSLAIFLKAELSVSVSQAPALYQYFQHKALIGLTHGCVEMLMHMFILIHK